MTKKLKSGLTAIACALAVLLILGGLVAKPAHAQQNGTHCPESIINDPNSGPLQLYLDHTCNAQGEPVAADPYSGGPGGHESCYTDWDGFGASTPGIGQVCQPCPSNWQDCTPCPNYAATCDDPPDPQPPGTGSLFHRIVSAVDWLTA